MNAHELLDLILKCRELNKSQKITKSTLEKAEKFAQSKPMVAEKLLNQAKEQRVKDEELMRLVVAELDEFTSPENKALTDRFKQEYLGVAPDPQKPVEQLEQVEDPLYQQLLGICKLFYQIERNGNPELHARKLATVFNDFDTALDYLKFLADENKARERIMHDACLVTLPQISYNLKVWQALARRHFKDMRFWKALTQGAEIEVLMLKDRKDRKTPQLPEIKRLSELYSQTYKAWYELKKHRTELNDINEEKFRKLNIQLNELKLELAAAYAGTELNDSTSIEVLDAYLEKYLSQSDPGFRNFIHHGLTKADYARFNDLKCVNDDTQIPNLGLDGKILGFDGFYLMKVDVTDRLQAMRACYLGRLTGCCQSLTGEAGQDCVIHGLTSPYGGFYFLCQGDINNPKIEDRLLAGCWVWRADSGALVIDSEEITDTAFYNIGERTMVIKMVEHHAFELVRQGYCDSVRIGAYSGISGILGILEPTVERRQDYTGYSDALTQQRSLFSKQLAYKYMGRNQIVDEYLAEKLPHDFSQVETLTPMLEDLLDTPVTLLHLSRHFADTTSKTYTEALYKAYSGKTNFRFTKEFSKDAQELEDILITEALTHPGNVEKMTVSAFNCQNISVLRKIAEHPAVSYNDAFSAALAQGFFNTTPDIFFLLEIFSKNNSQFQDILITEAINHPANLQIMIESAFKCKNMNVLRTIAEHPALGDNAAFSTALAQQFLNAFEAGKAKPDMEHFLLEFFTKENARFQDILFSKASDNEQNLENIVTLLLDHKRIDALSRMSKHEGLQARFGESLQKRDVGWLFAAVVENQLIPLDKLGFDTTLFDSYLKSLVPDLMAESKRAGILTRRMPGRHGLFIPKKTQREQLATLCAPINECIENLKEQFPDRLEDMESRLKTFFLGSSNRMRALMYSQNDLLKNISFDSAPLTSSHEIKDDNKTAPIKTTKTELTMDASVLVSYFSDRLEELGNWLLQKGLIDENGKQTDAFTYAFPDKDRAFSDVEFEKLVTQKLCIDPEENKRRVSPDLGESSLEFKRQFIEYYSDRKDEAMKFLEECCCRDTRVASNWLKGNLGYDLFRDVDFNSSRFYDMVHNLILTHKSNSPDGFNRLETHFAHRIEEFKAFISEKFNNLESLGFAAKHNLPYLKDFDLTYVAHYLNWDRPATYRAAREYFNHRRDEFDNIMLKGVESMPWTLPLGPFIFNQLPGIERLDFSNYQFIQLLESIKYDPQLMGLVRQYFSSRAEELEQCISSIQPNYGGFIRPEDFHNQIHRVFFNELKELNSIIVEDNAQKLSAYIKRTGFDVNKDVRSFYSSSPNNFRCTTLLEAAYSNRSVNCVATLLNLGAKVNDETMKDVRKLTKLSSPPPLICMKHMEEKQQKQEALLAKKKQVIDELIKVHITRAGAEPMDDQTPSLKSGS